MDKALHFLAGGAIAFPAAIFDPRLGFFLACAAGAAKELWDLSGRGTPSWPDFIATAFGGAVGTALGAIV